MFWLTFWLIILVCVTVVVLSTHGEKSIKGKVHALSRIHKGGKAKIVRVLKELKRKSFHLLGLLIPFGYYFGDKEGKLNRVMVLQILGVIIGMALSFDLLRFTSKRFRKFAEYIGILRKSEKFTLSGSLWFLLGSILTIFIFEDKLIAVASLVFLILGDTAASIVGISLGKIKIYKGKSLEGTLAMFFVCCYSAFIIFHKVKLFEYIALIGAFSACLTELLMKGINDNVSIPIISGIFMTLAKIRLKSINAYDSS